ncbi:MAG: hypothetical protein Q8N26_03180 [Myxococcales bacterium]|nr:hypothetical protein [Myxococcales bacterium]
MTLRTLLAFVAAFVVGLTLQACGTTPQRCSAATCPTGCCDSSGLCASGNTQSTCGSRGAACVGCSFGFQCISGACVATGTGTGGGFSGVGGGSTAGGVGGGNTAGGSAVGGGSSAGGSAGGSTAGGSAGGSTAGGSAGGSTAGGSAGGSTAGGSAVGGGSSAGGSAVGGGSSAGGSAVGGGSSAGGSAVGGGSAGGGSAGGSTGCSASCAGCCLNGVCQPGNTTGACGARGVACFGCSTNQFCQAGACTGANTGDTGATCTVSADCKVAFLGGAARECVGPYNPDGGPSGWPGGYCSNSGCDSFLDCPGATGSCSNDGFCYNTCFPANAGQGNCRPGYVCSDAQTVDGGTFPLCLPDCRNPGSRWCGPTGTCGALGYCQ